MFGCFVIGIENLEVKQFVEMFSYIRSRVLDGHTDGWYLMLNQILDC